MPPSMASSSLENLFVTRLYFALRQQTPKRNSSFAFSSALTSSRLRLAIKNVTQNLPGHLP